MSVTKKVQKNIRDNQSTISPEDKKWLEGRPSRSEVIAYVNNLWEHQQLPAVTSLIQMSSMVLQAILIDKGVCTGDEIKDITEKFIAEHQRRMATPDGTEAEDHEESKS